MQNWEPSLITRARQLVRPGQAFDTLHIVLAALVDPQAAGQVGMALASLDPVKRASWIAAVQTALDLHSEPATFNNDTTERLKLSTEMWRQEALRRGIFPNNVMVMKAAITSDRTVALTMNASGIQPETVIQNLDLRGNQPDSPPGTGTGGPAPMNQPAAGAFGGGWGSGPFGQGFQLSEERAAQTASQLKTQVQSSPALGNRDMHPVAMNHFLNELGAAMPSRDVPILAGRDGSPLPHLGEILADRLAFRTPFGGQQEPLNGCSAVYRLDVAVLRGLAAAPGGVDAVRVLQIVKQQVLDSRGILQLDHVEVLRDAGQVEVALRGELANRGPCLVFGVYFIGDEANPMHEAKLNLPNTRVIPVNDSTVEETKDFIKRFCAPLWERQGYSFTTDAFDSVIVMEPGTWVDLKRKTLPYVVVDLAVDTMQTANGGDSLIRATAQAALGALQDLLHYEWPGASAEVHARYQNVLRLAEEDIKALIQKPAPATRSQHKVLTRAHMVAQLLCPNESRFHLPPHTPFEAH